MEIEANDLLYLTGGQWAAFKQLGYDMSRCRRAEENGGIATGVEEQKDVMRKHLGFSAWAFAPLWE